MTKEELLAKYAALELQLKQQKKDHLDQQDRNMNTANQVIMETQVDYAKRMEQFMRRSAEDKDRISQLEADVATMQFYREELADYHKRFEELQARHERLLAERNAAPAPAPAEDKAGECVICLQKVPLNGAFVHGDTAHACCYDCAAKHVKKDKTCPLCREQSVLVKIF